MLEIMLNKLIIAILSGCFTAMVAVAQNAPVTIAPVKSACPGSQVIIPVTVTGFANIGSVSLTLKFNPAVLTWASASNTAGFPGLAFGHNIPGKVVISGWANSGITYPDNTVLFTLTLNYLGGSSALTWYDVGSTCEYTGYPGYFTLNDIPFSSYYINGQVGPLLDVNFVADNILPEVNQTVTFSDLTTGNPTAWSWTISPSGYQFVNSTSANSQNPQVQFTVNGPYTVALTAIKEGCSITKSLTNYIHSGISGLWTGITSAEWNTPSNWHNYLVPGSSTWVIIPEGSAYWPVFDGDLTIGSTIGSLTLQGATSMMTVTGTLTVSPDKSN
jgi:PKD repeat protein